MTQIEVDTIEELAETVARLAKMKKWYYFVGNLKGKAVRLKIYGLYLQIFDVDGVRHGGQTYTTQRELKATITGAI